MGIPTLPIDRIVLELMADAKHVKEIRSSRSAARERHRALRGEHVGTILDAD
jgi:hypothetical protein